MDKNTTGNPGHKKKKKKRRLTKAGRIVLFCVLGVLAVAIVLGILGLNQVLNRPESLFEASKMTTAAPTEAPKPTPEQTLAPNVTAVPTEEPTPTPEPSDIEQGKDIVNILLIGTDQEYKSYSADTHADVMMVVAVNFNEKKVDLFSFPRDTFGPVPGARGFYKLNSSINVGGGIDASDGMGYERVCDAVSYQLGGIAVDYYYAVNFDAVVSLVDAIGGVDYDVDIKFSVGEKVYNVGMQHLDGAAALQYLRLRKSSGNKSDVNRTNRQKRLLVTLFDQLKEKNMLTTIPALLNTAVTGFHTNTTVAQTTALANFALNIDADSIGMHTMPGQLRQSERTPWNYFFPFEDERVELIESIYGVTVEKNTQNSYVYLLWLERYGFLAFHTMALGDEVTAIFEPASPTEEQLAAKTAYETAYAALKDACDYAAEQLLVVPQVSTDASRAPGRACSTLRAALQEYADACGYTEKLTFNVPTYWWKDPYINEISVDFN